MTHYQYTQRTKYVKRDGTVKITESPINMIYQPSESSEVRKARSALRASLMTLPEDRINYYCGLLNTDANTIKQKRSLVRKNIQNFTLEQITN